MPALGANDIDAQVGLRDAFKLSPEPALSLAALRVVVPPLMLLAPGFRESARVAAWDRTRWVVPEGLGWFVRHVPISPTWVSVAQFVMVVTAFTATFGIRARRSLAALTLTAFYTYSIAQLTGFVWHDAHLLWFCALLAASPCDDVMSLEATKPLDAEGREYARPLFIVRLLFSCIYLFPGIHKLHTSGLAWALSDNLQNQMYWKWAEHGAVPSFRIDHYPWLLKLGGLFTLAFELGFPFLVFWRKTRPLAAALGLGFHLASHFIFRIAFPSLWLCYVALLDLRRPFARFKKTQTATYDPPRRSSALVGAAVGSVLVLGAAIQGARGKMQSYPFNCYPTFEWVAKSEMPDLEIDAISADGVEHALTFGRDARGYRTQREWGEIWRLSGAIGAPDSRRLIAYYRSVAARPENRALLENVTSVRFYRVMRSVKPENRQAPPVSKTPLLELRSQAAMP